MPVLDAASLREDFPLLSRTFDGKPLIYLDNAATTQKPKQVIDAVSDYYRNHNANVHRGVYGLARESTALYEQSREKVASFITAEPQELVFTRNTTESLNLLASSLGKGLQQGDEIVLSVMEHHSNMIPWRLLESRGVKVKYVPLIDEEKLDLEQLKKSLSSKTRIVSLTHASNVLGTIVDVRAAGEIVHDAGAVFVVDGAQSVPHFSVDVKKLDADFYAFSAHKMLGPSGVGALYGKEELLRELPVYQGGGEMIEKVTLEKMTFQQPPHRFEAGTPNMAGVAGFGAAVDYLRTVGMDAVREHEVALTGYAMEQLDGIGGMKIFGPEKAEDRTGVISFVMEGISPFDIASFAATRGMALRTGHHCAQPLHDVLGVPGTARVSFYLYNTKEEVDLLMRMLEDTALLREK
ncbi:MAG: cysteine desulfurase [DPANN group archaeon]|nr:cysteine desulfurase [DPANN group archaeon]